MSDARTTVLEFALSLPEAYEDHPWGEDVVKVNKKVFVFLGIPESERPSVSVKLPEAAPLALGLADAAPTSHGLGKAGWVTIPLASVPDAGVLLDWVEESYRAVASKRLVRLLDEPAAPSP